MKFKTLLFSEFRKNLLAKVSENIEFSILMTLFFVSTKKTEVPHKLKYIKIYK